jgi:fatty-acyl-CoA synthase
VSSVNPSAGESRAGSIGLRIPYQQMIAAILDDAGQFVRKAETNEIGSILVHGPNVFRGYLDPRHNAGLWVEIAGARWLNTGDLGRQDGDGYFWLTGRRKELIIRGGHNIDPKMIEEALQEHPAVALVAAIGRPDAYAGEVPVAFVELKPADSATEQELLDFAAAMYGSFPPCRSPMSARSSSPPCSTARRKASFGRRLTPSARQFSASRSSRSR